MSNLACLQKFKKSLINFLDELISQFPDEADLIILRILIKDQIPIQTVMENMKIKLVTCRKMVENRDEEFFLQNNSLFSDVSKSKVNHFKKIWRSDHLDDDDKKCIWLWMDAFIKLSDEYN